MRILSLPLRSETYQKETQCMKILKTLFIETKPVSLWDFEQKQKYREERIKKTGIPFKKKGLTLTVLPPMTPEQVLLKSGYRKYPRGYVKQIDTTHRLHAYIFEPDHIELHCDLIKRNKDGKIYHVATTFQCGAEKKRLQKFSPKPIMIPKETKKQRKARLRHFKDEYLSRDKYLKAMEELRNQK